MGYDPDYFVSSRSGDIGVAEYLLCPICQCVYDTPMVLDPCGHSFCKSCVTTLLDSGHENCPICRTKMIEGEKVGVPPNRALNELISNMTVRCMNCPTSSSNDETDANCNSNNKNGGCSWTGKLYEFQSHSELDCPMHVVSCPVQGCDYEGPRWSMQKHNIDSLTLHTDLLIASKLEQIKEELLGVAPGIGNPLVSNGDENHKRLDELQEQLNQKDRDINNLKARLLDKSLSDFFREWIIAKPPVLRNFVVYRPIKYLTGSISQIIVGVPGPSNSLWEGGLYPLLITFTPEGYERKEPPKCDFPETFFHPNVYEGNVRVNTLLEFGGSWDPSISLQEIFFCIQQLLVHPNHQGSMLYDLEEYREIIRRQAQKHDINSSEFLERAMVELHSKIDPEYKMPLESWENERWENLEEVRWKGRRSFQPRHEPRLLRRNLTGTSQGLDTMAPMESLEEGLDFISTINASGSDASNDENNDGGTGGTAREASNSLMLPTAMTTTTISIENRTALAPIANSNSTELLMPVDAGRLRDEDGNVCECSCCEQGSRLFIDREHNMRYIFGEGL